MVLLDPNNNNDNMGTGNEVVFVPGPEGCRRVFLEKGSDR